MEFKVNPFERFIIRNHSLLKWLVLIVGVASYTLLLEKAGVDFIWIMLTGLLIFVPTVYLIELTAGLKFRKIQSIELKELDLKKAVEASDKMLALLKEKQLDYIGTATLLKANALYNMGEKNEALSCIYAFLQKANGKKPPCAQIAENHSLLASIALYDYDFEKFEEHLNLVSQYISQSKRAYRKFYERAEIIKSHRLNEKLYKSEEYDETLEKAIVNKAYTFNGKQLTPDKVSPLSLIVAYSLLCEYFKRLGIDDKRRYYSGELIKVGNEQFKAYRNAKEFLENADKAD
ncbi:MAG: hypothetical protein IJK26_03340 [Clostridia bacterium]|nr:hypothetical protein [Clostridia bacterium]